MCKIYCRTYLLTWLLAISCWFHAPCPMPHAFHFTTLFYSYLLNTLNRLLQTKYQFQPCLFAIVERDELAMYFIPGS
jgi:hypothetical protein